MLKFKEIFDSSFIKGINLISGFNRMENEIFKVDLVDIRGEINLKPNSFALVKFDRPLTREKIKEYIEKLNADENISAVGFFIDKNKNIVLEEARRLNNVKKPMVLIPAKYTVENIKDNVEETKFFKYIYKNIELKTSETISTNPLVDREVERLVRNLGNTFKKEVHIIDVIKERTYTSQGRVFKTLDQDYEEVLNPSYEHEKVEIYNRINIVRHTSYEGIYKGRSWIVLPVVYESITMFYLVIWLDEINEEFDVNDYKYLYTAYMYLILKYGEAYLENRYKRQKEEQLIARLLFDESLDRDRIYYDLKQVLDYVKRSFVVISIVDRYKDNNFYNDNFYIMREAIDIIHLVLGRGNILTGILTGDRFVMIYNFEKEEESKETFTKKISEIVTRMSKVRDQHDFKVGIGSYTDDIGKIKDSYNESLEAINLSEYILKDRLINFYEDLGIFSIIKLEDIYDFILREKDGVLSKLFKKESLDLLETLDVFLKNDCNYKLASEELFIHSNTLRYRIGKIEELLGVDLSDNDDKFNISFILKFKKIIYKIGNR